MSLDRHFGALLGHWRLTGEVLGERLEQDVIVESILGGAHIRIHYLPSIVTPFTDEPYEAIAILGWEREDGPVMHLFDTFGSRFDARGVGEIVGEGSARFRWDYPDGPFHIELDAVDDGWEIRQFSIEGGTRREFGVKRLRPLGLD